MTVIVSTRHDVNLATLRRVGLEGERVRVSGRALKLMTDTHERFQRYVAGSSDSFIYGVTSGYGPAAGIRRTLREAREIQRRGPPWLGLAFGGIPLPEYVSRAAIFAGLAALVSGHTAAHPAWARAVCHCLDGPVPRLPSRGLVAAGELMPNFILRTRPGPAIPGEGFSAGPANGAQTSGALAGLTAIFARRRLDLAERLFALSVEAFAAPLDAYHPALKQFRDDPFEAAALDALGLLLEGAAPARRPLEAPASYRILPQILGRARRALASLEEVAAAGLSQVVTNPTFVPTGDGGEWTAISTGGFHNATAGPAIDAVAASWADLATVAQRHIVKFHQGRISLLPDRLLPAGTDYTTGYSTTYLEYVPNQAIEEMRRLAQPTLLTPAEIAASGQDDVAITAPIAYLAEREVAARFDEVLTVLAVTCSQVFHLTGRMAPPSLAATLALIREFVPPIESRRPVGEECGRLAAAFSAALERGGTALVPGGPG